MQIDYQQMKFIHPTLQELAYELEVLMGPDEAVMTSLYRIDDNGVHGTLPVRGMDVRCRSKEYGDQLCAALNERWVYDPDRPEMKVAMYHDVGLGAHIHLQVHSKTEKLD